jgi:hypothetical protein
MAITRLDNKRIAGDEPGVPTLTINKSGATFSAAALQLLGIAPGVDFVSLGYDNDSSQYVLSKAADEKSGKKVSANSTTNSESIYKRLNEGSVYVLGVPITENNVKYFPLQEGTVEAPADEEDNYRATDSYRPVTGDAYDAKYGNAEATPVKPEADFL